jgi:hypothetical protein
MPRGPGRSALIGKDAWVRLYLRLILVRRAPANAPGVPFDFSQGGIERVIWPAMYVGHGLEGMALRVDRELTGGVLPDVPHRTTEEVCQMPDCASLCWNYNYIHVDPLAGRAFVAKAVDATRIYIADWIDASGRATGHAEWRVRQRYVPS